MGSTKVLVDYSQSQLLTSNHHISSLESMAIKNAMLLQKGAKNAKERVERGQKIKERELNKIKRRKK